MRSKTKRALGAAVLVLLLAGCGDDDDETNDTGPPETEAPPRTDPPVTDPPVTDPPATDPPATDPPATDPPATDPPATDPPTTDPPATEPSVEGGTYTVPVDFAAVPGTSGGTFPAVYVFDIDPVNGTIMAEQQGLGQRLDGLFFNETNAFSMLGSDSSTYAEGLAGLVFPDESRIWFCTFGGPADLGQRGQTLVADVLTIFEIDVNGEFAVNLEADALRAQILSDGFDIFNFVRGVDIGPVADALGWFGCGVAVFPEAPG